MRDSTKKFSNRKRLDGHLMLTTTLGVKAADGKVVFENDLEHAEEETLEILARRVQALDCESGKTNSFSTNLRV